MMRLSCAKASARRSCSPKSRAVAEGDHELAVDVVGRFEAENVRVIEACGELDFLGEIGERFLAHQVRVWNLQRHIHAFERVERAEHGGERANRELREQAVLSKFLTGAEHRAYAAIHGAARLST
jgi:hypothetical protein